MTVTVHFYSYFKDLAKCESATETLDHGASVNDLLQKIFVRFPQLKPMQKSMLVAVGVEYQPRDYVLREDEEISIFPPVQGG